MAERGEKRIIWAYEFYKKRVFPQDWAALKMQRLVFYHGISSICHSLWECQTAKKLWSNIKPVRFKCTFFTSALSISFAYSWEMDDASCLHINVLLHNFNNTDLICHVSTWFYNIYIVSYYLNWWSYSRSIIFSQGPEKSPFKWLTGFSIRPWHLPDTKVLLGSTDIIFGAFYVFSKLKGASLNGT